MASNRIEKLQMRQRGAGTRKIKEVDFGFSLGFSPPAQESSQAASQPADSDLNTAPAPAPASAPPPHTFDAPPPASEPTTTSAESVTTVIPQVRSTPSPTRNNAYAVSQNQLRRTPGSARNKLPPRPSTFDIPADNEPELERSNKRRKLDSPKGESPSIGAQVEIQNINNFPNGTSEEVSQPLDENRAIPIRTITPNHAPLLDQEPAAEAPSVPTNGPNEIPQEGTDEAGELSEPGDTARPEAPRMDGTISPGSDSSKSSGRRRGKKGRRSPSQDDVANLESTEAVEPQAVETESAKLLPSTEPVGAAPTRASPHEPEPPRTRDKRTRSRTPASASPVVADEAPTGEPGSEPIEATQEHLDEPQPPEIQEMRTRSRTSASLQSSVEPAASDRQLIKEANLKPAGVPQEAEPQKPDTTRTRDKRTRSRTPAITQPPAKPTTDKATAEVVSAEAVPSVVAGKGVRGRKKKNLEPAPDLGVTELEEVVPDEVMAEPFESTNQPNGIDKGKKRAGRPKKQAPSPQAPEEPVTSKKRQREEQVELGERVETPPAQERPNADAAPAGKGKKQRIVQEPSLGEDRAEPEPEAEGSRLGKRRRGRQGREPTPQAERTEPDAEAPANRAGMKKQQPQERLLEQEQPVQESDFDRARVGRGKKRREKEAPTTVQEEQPEAEAEDVERARVNKGKKRQERAPTAEEERQEPQPEIERESRPEQPDEASQENATEDGPQFKKRKPRQPRGETVPVTVHRLANPALLGGESPASSDEEDAGADEPSGKQATKFPSRGGVNAADVLAQICRETLEKTLTTLKTGIENEANATRRAEWTLRRKAVEAYVAELEGRLFDLSEMLDSNFMLSAKVKKAKRNMLDLRSRLDRVRREREAVALRMDAVRREHTKEEQAGLARSTINHSLHNLDLARERGQNRTAAQDESLTAGLELRLRSLARSVSSSVSDSYGGILNQIKSFNAQLEATARRLEE